MGDQTTSGLKSHVTKAPLVSFSVDHLDQFKVNGLRILNSTDYTNIENQISAVTPPSGIVSLALIPAQIPLHPVPGVSATLTVAPFVSPVPWAFYQPLAFPAPAFGLSPGIYHFQIRGNFVNVKESLVRIITGGTNGVVESSYGPSTFTGLSGIHDARLFSFLVQVFNPTSLMTVQLAASTIVPGNMDVDNILIEIIKLQ